MDKIESTQKSSENPLIKEIYSVQIFHYRNPVIKYKGMLLTKDG
jgi:hypothetical protein